ncbi:DUF4331 domain-containing protein [Actinomycetes bacterium KLBMP 9797]
MSSHREAPEIAKDPVADSTDLYAFVSPDHPDTVTLIANYVPLQSPASGPNFFEFGDDVLYEIHIDNDGDGHADVTYQFRFETKLNDENTFLYNTGPIEELDSETWNRRQFYSVTKVDGHGNAKVLARNVPSPPVNVGRLSIPNYKKLADDATFKLKTGEKVFAGQRAEGFFVDLGAIFDLGTLRPFQNLHLLGQKVFQEAGEAVNATDRVNVHSIAIQVPKKDLVSKKSPVIGVWTTASRRQVRVLHGNSSDNVYVGPNVQVSRLGNPLFNEVIVPMSKKDLWNSLPPIEDKNFAGFVEQPELARLLPVLYPGVFDNLAKLNEAKTARADLVAVLLTGIPEGLIEGFQNNTGDIQADMLRLNTDIPPSKEENRFGLLGGDLAGFPNGRRVKDDVVSIALRAVAGATFALVDKNFKPDEAVADLSQGLSAADVTADFLHRFPYLGLPYDGFNNPS